MIVKTDAVVLRTMKYRESSRIATLAAFCKALRVTFVGSMMVFCDALQVAERQLAETRERIRVGKLADLDAVAAEAEVALVWDPPWSAEMMTPEGKKILGIA